MNPPPPFPPYHQPSSRFTSLPPPPLPPPSPPPPPPPSVPHLQPLPDIAAPDVSTAFPTLTSLLCLTETTLNSLSPFLPTPPSSALIPCPFNPIHLLPHSSLFSHYLSCPSSLTLICDPHSLLHSLQYPHTLHSTPTNSFTQSIQNPTSTELSFSLEDFLNLPQNFFYSNCPGAVIFDTSNTNGSSYPMLTLPGLLFAECANFGRNKGLDEKGFLLDVRFFPSEIWAVRNEIEGWVDYPSSYSCRLLRSILSLCKSDFSCLLAWIIENSPKYGVVIDLAMRDHIVLLFKLCLKAIVREAIGKSVLLSNKREDRELGLGENIYDCPVLMKVMMWLGSQLTILYGEVSGNSFAINMLKKCVLDSALSASCFPVIEKAKESSEPKEVDGNSEGAFEKSGKEETRSMMDGSVQKSMIFVCQVAAAVAALYERSWLEERITKLRDARQLTAYQRFLEHENISNSAQEERQKRSNYRPIIEHDGVLSKRIHSQGANRIKTTEELLAEERDYKRRRMSYRGKKIKRTTLQVMRDIIGEFMDEIKLAGGLSFAKTEGAQATAFGSSSVHNIASDVLELRKNQSALELPRAQSRVCRTQSCSDNGHRSMNSEDNYGEHYKKRKRDSGSHRESADNDRSSKRERHDRKDSSKSHDRQKSGQHLHEHSRNRGKRDDSEVSGETISQSSGGNLRKLHEQKSHRREESRHDSELWHKHARKKHKDRRSDSVHTEFADRYDPSNNDEYDA